MIAISSCLFLLFSIILFITSVLFPKKEKELAGKFVSRALFVVFIVSLFQGDLVYSRGKKSIRRRWDVTLLFISTIFLVLIEIFTAMVVTNSETFNLIPIYKSFASNTYGLILTVQLVSWFLLMIMGMIWQYIDNKEHIQVPEDVKNRAHMGNEKIQCNSCSSIFQFDIYSGICPKCGTYNPLNQNTFYQENRYKRKKSTAALVKPIIWVIVIFSIGIIGALVDQKINGKDDLNFDINIPTINLPEVENLTTNNVDSYFTPEEIDDLLEEIKADNNLETIYHKEIYDNDLRNSSGEKYNEVTIFVATDDSEKVSWYQFYKYQESSENHNAGEIEFYIGAESDSLTKDDIIQ
jgi:hypothetical protein